MAKNLVAPGDVLDYTVPSATTIASGDPVLIGDLLGVALIGGTTGDMIPIQVEGVFTLAKTTGEAWTLGSKLYWSAGTSKVTTTATSNKHIGYAAADAASGDTTGNVKFLS